MVRSRPSRFLIACILAAGLACLEASHAQAQAAFGRSSLFVNVGDRVNRPILLEGWQLNQFVAAGVATKFYAGEAQIGVQHVRGVALPGIATDARLFFFNVGWGPLIELPIGVTLAAAFDVGHVYMRFPQETISFRKSEGEVAYGLRARVTVPIAKGVSLDVGGRWFHIFTSDPIDLTVASAGLRYTFDTPAWIRGIIE